MTEPAPARPNLAHRAILGVVQFMVVLLLVLFLPARTIDWWQAWVFCAVFGLSSLLMTLALLRNDTALVERRMRGGPTAEREASQKVIQTFTFLLLLVILVVPALDHRFGWSAVPTAVSLLGDAIVVVSFWLIHLVFRANSFASSTVEISGGQKVISTGPYAIVRHPMYAASLPMFAGMPLALGSWWGLIPAALLVPVLIAASPRKKPSSSAASRVTRPIAKGALAARAHDLVASAAVVGLLRAAGNRRFRSSDLPRLFGLAGRPEADQQDDCRYRNDKDRPDRRAFQCCDPGVSGAEP